MPLQPVLPIERIAQSILVIRGQKVMIAADLADKLSKRDQQALLRTIEASKAG